jgi:DNA mismatch repair protein MutS
MSARTTVPPMFAQYKAIKAEYPDVILLFRLGDFYEMFGEDAHTGSKVLEIALTKRGFGKGHALPMCGFPHVALEKSVARLVKAGHRVAVCEQTEDAADAKTLVRRQVTRVVTAGTAVEDSLLASGTNNYLAAVAPRDGRFGFSVVDLSTGEFLTTEIDTAQGLASELSRLAPAEIIVTAGHVAEVADAIGGNRALPALQERTETLLDPPYETLTKHLGVANLRGFGCEEMPLAQEAAAQIIGYLQNVRVADLSHIASLTTYSTREFMTLDESTRRNLEITEAMSGRREHSLLGVLDMTETPMGARLLRRWLSEPLLDADRIRRRQDLVAAFHGEPTIRADLRRCVSRLCDFERITSRVTVGSASPRDMSALCDSLDLLPQIGGILNSALGEDLRQWGSYVQPLRETVDLIRRAIADSPPHSPREPGVIREGFDGDLDALRAASRDGKAWIAALEERERNRTKIKSLRVGYNSVFGYYLEVTKANLSQVPDDYIRKQTLTNAERYITPDLKEWESKVLGADEKALRLEYELFCRVRAEVAESARAILDQARLVAKLDCYAALAEAAARNAYVRPQVATDGRIEIRGGRHPVVELTQSERFVPNDTLLDPEENQLLIITGPNMAGKSTYLRQTALIVLMAQVGSFVPADTAHIGIVDRIFTRAGASDDLATGQSTFMIEMTETANILNNATDQSLIVLDEIGRGTSTYDGLSIAWAVAEHVTRVGAKTLFATHYHHLNDLEGSVKGVRNYRVAVKEEGERVIWLRKIVPGGTDKSYGIQVARMAGVPHAVVVRAAEILRQLEEEGKGRTLVDRGVSVAPAAKRVQLALFEAARHPVLEEIEGLDTYSLSPLEALNVLHDLKRRLGEEGKG